VQGKSVVSSVSGIPLLAYPLQGATVADDFPDYTSDDAGRLYDSLKLAGLSWVAITPCGYMDSTFDTKIGWTAWSKRDYPEGIRNARSHGMKVMIKPYLWSMDFWTKKRWTGDIRFDDKAKREEWFRSYTSWMLQCASYAKDGGADLLCVGLELPHLTPYDVQWRRLIDTIRTVYKGALTYASHGLDEAEAIRFWDALDVVGVNIYPTLSRDDHPTDNDLQNGWKPVCDRLSLLSKKTKRKVVLTEAGFRSVEKAYDKPWEWPEHRPRKINDEHQRQAYASLASACFREPWYGGVFWWKMFTDPRKNNEGRDGFSPQGKSAWYQMKQDLSLTVQPGFVKQNGPQR
ncbi:MAG: hypothetical protein NTX15_03935, partial [Candidatus Kapabacteria bacterium]|nr:hypothetical protein [Candidatus Kapabacteria bacterium]